MGLIVTKGKLLTLFAGTGFFGGGFVLVGADKHLFFDGGGRFERAGGGGCQLACAILLAHVGDMAGQVGQRAAEGFGGEPGYFGER